MSNNEDCSDYRLEWKDYPYFTEDEFNAFRLEGKPFVEKVHSSCKKRYETRIAKYSLYHDKAMNLEMDLNIVVLGKTGSGKSSTANTILGSNAYEVDSSSNSASKASLDKKCTYNNREITVVDTPGIHDNGTNNATVAKELARKAFLLKDGVHCFIICISVSDTRFTEDLIEMLKLIKQDGQGNFFDYCMLAYTKAETELETCTLGEFLEEKKKNVHNGRLLENINNRVVAVNNKCLVPAETLRNRSALIEKVYVVVANNRQNWQPDIFTDDVFKAAGKLQEKIASVVQVNSFHQGMVNAAIEVIIENTPFRLSYNAFLKKVIIILKKSEQSEEFYINGTGTVRAKYVNQIRRIYDEIQPEFNTFMDILVPATIAAAAAALTTTITAAAGAGAVVAAGGGAVAAVAVGILSLLI